MGVSVRGMWASMAAGLLAAGICAPPALAQDDDGRQVRIVNAASMAFRAWAGADNWDCVLDPGQQCVLVLPGVEKQAINIEFENLEDEFQMFMSAAGCDRNRIGMKTVRIDDVDETSTCER